MAASGSGGETARLWTASSTWTPAGGAAVEDAVSFETSDLDAEESPAGVVLTRPATDEGEDAPPCEVTVSFRGTYEIHRVYVRSTARIYEIYQSTNAKGTGKDYLCTVRCGPATKEPQLSGEEDNASVSERREHEMKSISSSGSDDSWVDVKIPESPDNTSESQERNVVGICQEHNLVHYEATAEMTDVSPCVSLTVRLLSLHSKTSVHIEEIYIFADPVEPTNDDSVTGPGNMGGSSLLAMLVPGLMQMSKSRNYKIDDGYFSHGSRNQPTQDHAVKEGSPNEKIAQETGPCVSDGSSAIGRGINSTYGGPVSNEKSNQAQLPFKDPMYVQLPVTTTEYARAPSVADQLVSKTDQLTSPPMNGMFYPYNHIETKLDTLLSKVEKVELYCSTFEDRMIKPLSSIEARLQRLEQQFDSFSVEIKYLRDSSARISAPDGPYDTNSQQKVHNDSTARTPASTTDKEPGLCVRAPDSSSEDSCNYHVTHVNQVNFQGSNAVPRLLVKAPEFSQTELTGEKLHEGPISPVTCVQSSEEKERKTSPGLVVKVPEFPDDDDDDDEVEEEKKIDVGDHTQDDTQCRNSVDGSKSKNRVSVNGALASALEALLMSSKGTSSSKSDVFPASNLSAENNYESLSCSLSPGNEMPTKDGLVDQIPGSIGSANLDGTFISCQEIDGAPHTSLSKPVLDSKVDINEKNNHLDSEEEALGESTVSLVALLQHLIPEESVDITSCINELNNGPTKDDPVDQIPGAISSANLDPTFIIFSQEINGAPCTSLSEPVFDSKVDINEENNHLDSDNEAFGASTVPLCVLPQRHISEEAIDDGTFINEQNNGPKLDTMPIITSSGPMDPPQPPTPCETVDNRAQMIENRPFLSLAEFLAARNSRPCKNGTSETSCSSNGSELPSFEKTLAEAGKNSENISHLLVKKALEVDSEDECNSSVPVGPTSGGSSDADFSCVTRHHNRIETVSDKDTDLENSENSVRLSVGADSVNSQCSDTAFQENLTENSSFPKQAAEYSWSDFINMESFTAAYASEPVVSARTAEGRCVEDLTGIGANSTVTPIAGEELQKFCDLLYEYKGDMVGMTSTEKRTSKSSLSLEVLLAESSESEAQISDTEDTDNGTGIGSAQKFGSFSSDDNASATTGPLIDVGDLLTESEPEPEPSSVETFADGSSGEPISLI